MKQTILFFLLLFFHFSGFSQNSWQYFCGYVVDEQTNHPISGASVSIFSSDPNVPFSKVITTNANGAFCDSLPYAGDGTFYTFRTTDCNGNPVIQRVQIPFMLTVVTELRICTRSVPSNCQAYIAVDTINTDGTTFNFEGYSQGTNIISWVWEMGDGSFAFGQNVSHTYTRPGVYNVCLTVSTADRCTSRTCKQVTVRPPSNNCFANFRYSRQGNTLAFVNLSQGAPPVTYIWNFGDGTTSTEINPFKSYNRPGLYAACLTIRDGNGCTSTKCDSVIIEQTTPNCEAKFTFSVRDNRAVFVNSSTGAAPITYFWTFGDGTTSNLENPNKTYTASGDYLTCLRIVTGNGCSSTRCDTVRIRIAPPCVADFEVIDSAGVFFFINRSSGEVTRVRWAFGDGSFSSEMNPNKTYTQPGTYNVSLTIFGPNCQRTVTKTITVPDANSYRCRAKFSYEMSGLTSIMVKFKQESTTNHPGGLTYLWYFDDGTTSTEAEPTKVYDAVLNPGPRLVCLTVSTRDQRCRDTYCDTLIINNPFPFFCAANFSYRIEGTNVILENTSQGPEPLSYFWFAEGFSSQEKNPTFNFGTPGPKLICLSITSSDRTCRQTKCDTVYIPAAPACIANYTYIDSVGYTFFFDQSQGNITSWSWDFGDGNSSTRQNPVHYYEFPGVYPVTLTISGPNCLQKITMSVIVQPRGSLNKIAGCLYSMVDSILYGATVYLIQYDSVQGTLTAIDSVTVSSYNSELCYSFSNVPDGKYLVKAALLPIGPAYVNNLPTYYGDALYWNQATYVTVPPSFYAANIVFIPGQNNGGPGFVGGYVSQGANKNSSNNKPVEGATVIFKGKDNNVAIYTTTGADGSFELKNIPYGTYTLTTDALGLYHKPQTIVISPSNTVYSNVEVIVSKTDIITSLPNELTKNLNPSFYPNPVKEEAFLTFTAELYAEYCIDVLSLTGKNMHRHCFVPQNLGANSISLPTENLPNGVYLLKLQMDNSPAWSQKFIKLD
jgi:PKD repeat protein